MGLSTSETTAAINTALSVFQGNVASPKKTKTAKAGSYSYSYADLDGILETIRPTLLANGLGFVQGTVSNDQGRCGVITRITHESGEWIESPPLFLPSGDTAQTYGSALTYARRYSLTAALGITTDEDDDGASAKAKPKAAAKPQEPPKPADPEADKLRELVGKAISDGRVTGEKAQEAANAHGIGTAELLAAASFEVMASLVDTLGLTPSKEGTNA